MLDARLCVYEERKANRKTERNVTYVRTHNKPYLIEISKIFPDISIFMPIIIWYFSPCTPLWFVLLLYCRIVHPHFASFCFALFLVFTFHDATVEERPINGGGALIEFITQFYKLVNDFCSPCLIFVDM